VFLGETTRLYLSIRYPRSNGWLTAALFWTRPGSESRELLQGILRDEWKFDGLLVGSSRWSSRGDGYWKRRADFLLVIDALSVMSDWYVPVDSRNSANDVASDEHAILPGSGRTRRMPPSTTYWTWKCAYSRTSDSLLRYARLMLARPPQRP
jgi:hypothetical protein